MGQWYQWIRANIIYIIHYHIHVHNTYIYIYVHAKLQYLFYRQLILTLLLMLITNDDWYIAGALQAQKCYNIIYRELGPCMCYLTNCCHHISMLLLPVHDRVSCANRRSSYKPHVCVLMPGRQLPHLIIFIQNCVLHNYGST